MWDGSFHRVQIRGLTGSLIWGHQTAARLSAWVIRKGADGRWVLTGTLAAVNAFHLRQTPLYFSAPREGGYWCWGVESVQRTGATALTARLGPPEQ